METRLYLPKKERNRNNKKKSSVGKPLAKFRLFTSISGRFLSFYIVDLVFCLPTVYTCDCWARPSTFLQLEWRHLKKLRCIPNIQRLTEEDSIFWFDLCGWLPTILSNFGVGLSSDRNPVLGIIYYRHCHQLFLQRRLKFYIQD